MAVKLAWKFPKKDFLVMRIETVFVFLLAALVFIISFFQFGKSFLPALLFSIIFLGLYILFSYIVQRVRVVEERYSLTEKHFEVVRKKRSKTKKEKVPLKDIVHHKLDKLFLGGYMLVKSENSHHHKHLLFFNTGEELEKFENFLKKHLKGKKK